MDGVCTFVMLNPSKADADIDDPTIRKCVNYCRLWGYGTMLVVNVFAFRSTDPKMIKEINFDPVGPENEYYVRQAVRQSNIVICAWGTQSVYMEQDKETLKWIRDEGVWPCMLELSKEGHPKHPLYLKGDLQPQSWDI